MNMTTVEIFDIIVEAGIEKEKAKEVSETIVTKDLLNNSVSRIEDKIDIRFSDMQRQVNKLIGIVLAINGAMLVSVLFG